MASVRRRRGRASPPLEALLRQAAFASTGQPAVRDALTASPIPAVGHAMRCDVPRRWSGGSRARANYRLRRAPHRKTARPASSATASAAPRCHPTPRANGSDAWRGVRARDSRRAVRVPMFPQREHQRHRPCPAPEVGSVLRGSPRWGRRIAPACLTCQSKRPALASRQGVFGTRRDRSARQSGLGAGTLATAVPTPFEGASKCLKPLPSS